MWPQAGTLAFLFLFLYNYINLYTFVYICVFFIIFVYWGGEGGRGGCFCFDYVVPKSRYYCKKHSFGAEIELLLKNYVLNRFRHQNCVLKGVLE